LPSYTSSQFPYTYAIAFCLPLHTVS
jgi:hypothetical protein